MLFEPNTDARVKSGNHEPNVNVAAVITLAATSKVTHNLLTLTYSYEGNMASSGSLIIAHGTSPTTVWKIDIEQKATADGNGASKLRHFTFPGGFPADVGEQVVITLAAAGSSANGIVSCTYQ